MRYKVYSDGASLGNPGSAGCGFVVKDSSGNTVYKGCKPIGLNTNNVAEYTALIIAVEYIKTLNPDFVEFFLDSELVVKQIKGEYKVKNPVLYQLWGNAVNLLKDMRYSIAHIPREKNAEADMLSKKAAKMNKI